MRACFLGQNVFALGFGIAALQAPPMIMDKPVGPAADRNVTPSPSESVANPQRLIRRRPRPV
jgi:hypothetical protein